jgi:hypothetical protein
MEILARLGIQISGSGTDRGRLVSVTMTGGVGSKVDRRDRWWDYLMPDVNEKSTLNVRT